MGSYDQKILKVLAEAGTDGLSIQKIVYHVYNSSNTFFETVSLEDVHRYVRQFLQRNSKNKDSMIESTGVRGVYRINEKSSDSQQLMLMFSDEVQEAEEKKPVVDQSLSLF
ncbi:MAG: hypothetical protein IKN01_08235 [Prevotella sp.]|nr:hypothetical protein [Prevotella sp.]